jgi:hypothetical protein
MRQKWYYGTRFCMKAVEVARKVFLESRWQKRIFFHLMLLWGKLN